MRSFLPASCMLIRVERAWAARKLCLLVRDVCKHVLRLGLCCNEYLCVFLQEVIQNRRVQSLPHSAKGDTGG